MGKLSFTKPLERRRGEAIEASGVPILSKLKALAATAGSEPVRWLILAGVLLIVATVASTAVMVERFRENALSNVERELKNTARLLARHVDQSVAAVDLVEQAVAARIRTEGIASTADFDRRLSDRDVGQMLKGLISALPYVADLELIGSDGQRINSSQPLAASADNVAGEKYFNILKSNPRSTLFIGEPVRSGTDGAWSVVLARRLAAPGDDFLGVVVARIKLQFLEDFLTLISSGKNSSYALFRDDGILMLRYPHIDSVVGHFFPAGLGALGNGNYGITQIVGKMDGKNRLLTAYRLQNYPLFVSVGIEEDAILSNWRKQTTFPFAVAGILVTIIAIVVSLIVKQQSDEHRRAEQNLAEQKQRLDTAVNNMVQGLLLFDAKGRIVVCNERYVAMYGLSPDVAKPGCTLHDLIMHRKECGGFDGDVEEYCSSILSDVASGRVIELLIKTPDGRAIKIVNKPLENGGWIATHEDITERQRAEIERDRNRKFIDLILENVPVPVFVKDATDRRFVLVNRAAEEFWGISRSEVIGRTSYGVFSAPDADSFTERDDELILLGGLLDSERDINTPRNGIRRASVTRLTIKDDNGGPKYLIGVIRDITEQRRLERERDQNLAFLNAVIETVPVTIVVKDARTLHYTLVNRAAEKLWGISRDNAIGKHGRDILPAATADRLDARERHLLESNVDFVDETHEVETPGNGIRMVRSQKIVLPGEDGKPEYLLGVVEDVTESARADERIRYMAHHDLLTGLCNRVLFMDKVAEAIANLRHEGEAFAIFMLDLDRFKEVNDSLGHAAGDELLKEAAERLRGAVGKTDILARLGGDEFAVIQGNATHSAEAASALAKSIIDIFAEPFDVCGNDVTVGVSIGISLAPTDGDEPSDLMKKADLALYRAKSEGRNGYSFFDARLAKDAEMRHHLERDLRAAIFCDELEVHFQPIIDAVSREAFGVEALARWRHPQLGFVPPAQFIPLAEETGLVVPLGEQILRKACAAAAVLPPEIKVAVNLSPLQFKKSNLVELVSCVLAELNVPPERLELEITENVLIDAPLDVLRIIRQLKDLGVSIVLDDFGTGYSSLSYLTMFPFDKIKIDKSFTQNLTRRTECAAIVSAVRALAYSLNITVVAEGVETEEQFELLRAAGVNAVQGYLFGKPCPLSALRLAHGGGDQAVKKRA